jgi:hypothetical protein
MKKSIVAGLTLLALLAATDATAGSSRQGTLYSGGQLALLFISEDGAERDAESTALTYRLGAYVTSNVAVEGRFGVSRASTGLSGVRTEDATKRDVELDRLFGLYLTGHLPVPLPGRNVVTVFGTVGYTDVRMDASLRGLPPERSGGMSFGIGAELTSYDGFLLNVEYMHYISNDGLKVSGIAVGGVYAF